MLVFGAALDLYSWLVWSAAKQMKSVQAGVLIHVLTGVVYTGSD